jgi:tungstate transport system substrate-binding protein
MRNLFLALSISLAAVCLLLQPVPVAAAAPSKTVILATTTSTQDSGLLDLLVPLFEKSSGYSVKTIAVGSGQALKMGEKGEADVLLVHSPAAEKQFMAAGFGSNRRLVMHNDFIIVGPLTDPAKIRSITGAAEAMRQLAASGKALFSPDAGRKPSELGL